jgi:hypothetical protein
MTPRTATIATLILLAGGALAGCTAEQAQTESTPTPTPTPSAPCIVGQWEAGAEALQPLYDAIPKGLDYPAATFDPTATVRVDFAADGTFAFTQDVAASLVWMKHAASVRLGGDMDGTYTTTGDAIALAATGNRLTVVPADDETASALFAVATQETLDEWPVSASSFACTDDALTLVLDTEGHDASVVFARR